LFSEFPEVDADEDFKARFPGRDDSVPIGFDLSRITRGDKEKRLLKRLDSRVGNLQIRLDDLTDADRLYLVHASATILMNVLPTLDAQQKRAATAFLLERMGGDPKLAEIFGARRKAIKAEP
jgi:hypothetical protein